MGIGDRLKQARIEKGWSTRRLSMETERLGRRVSHSFISQIENPRYEANPSLETIEVLAQALGKPISYFFEANDAAEEEIGVEHEETGSGILRRLHSLIRDQGSSIEMLARKIGISKSDLAGLDDDDPNLALVQKIALTCNTTMHYLLGRIDDPAPLPGVAVAHHDPAKGVEPGEPMPPETQLIVERAIINARKEWGWDK